MTHGHSASILYAEKCCQCSTNAIGNQFPLPSQFRFQDVSCKLVSMDFSGFVIE